ncbi:MAG: hypothetical protein K6G55_07740 [Selenomonadaceae bacterium]|nr:hypothetical protein [Selenomonadaceae bacterium]
MTVKIKFTVGSIAEGYKTVAINIDGDKVSYKILRSGLLDTVKKTSPEFEMPDKWFEELNAIEIFSWEENYSADGGDGIHWELIAEDDEKIYRGHGVDAYPETFARFMDWLDVIIPELEFVDRKRSESLTIYFDDEKLCIDRRSKSLTVTKKNSRHIYDIGDEIKNLFDCCQKFFDNTDTTDADINSGTHAEIEIVRHDGTRQSFETIYSDSFISGLTDFLELIRTTANDLNAKIFAPPPLGVVNGSGKYILCKVQFKGSYKSYTYRTEDETLTVGDILDVPVGRNNEINQARLVDIAYCEEYELPFPLSRIKSIIGKHVGEVLNI